MQEIKDHFPVVMVYFLYSRPGARKSLVPCVAAGGMKEYADFVKEGNFTPLTVMNPELGMETAIFAEDREHHMSGAATAALSGRMTGMSGEEGLTGDKENMNMDEAHAKVTEIFKSITDKTKNTDESYKVLDKPLEKRYKGRRRKISVNDAIVNLSSTEQGIGRDDGLLSSANSSRSSGYQSQLDTKENVSIAMIGEVSDDFRDNGSAISNKYI